VHARRGEGTRSGPCPPYRRTSEAAGEPPGASPRPPAYQTEPACLTNYVAAACPPRPAQAGLLGSGAGGDPPLPPPHSSTCSPGPHADATPPIHFCSAVLATTHARRLLVLASGRPPRLALRLPVAALAASAVSAPSLFSQGATAGPARFYAVSFTLAESPSTRLDCFNITTILTKV
jgi:hypothetical protein